MLKAARVKSWQGKCVVVEVWDGDTIHVTIDLGFNVFINTKVRIHNCWAPELKEPGGEASRNFLAGWLPPGTILLCESKRLDRYGRAEADLLTIKGEDVATVMISTGHAKATQ